MSTPSNAPIDPALLRRAPALVTHLVIAAVGAAVLAVATVTQAEVLARTLGRLVTERSHDDLLTPFIALVTVGLSRAGVAAMVERSAGRTMASLRNGQRTAIIEHAAIDADRTTPGLAAREATVATAGIDRLESYVRDYLPALFVAVAVPVAAGMRILSIDWISAAIVIVTVPLIPVFMVLIGLMTEQRTERQWAMLQRLSGHFLDVLEGLPTLRLFGRASAQAQQVRKISEQYRSTTVRTLRIAFLSALVLELLATLSVAIIAVEIGLRMASGGFDLHDGLVVLLLAPECYLPLRRVGAGFHAAQAGRDAAADLDEVLERPVLASGDEPAPEIAAIEVRNLDVARPGRPALLGGLDVDLRLGEIVAVVGPSGTGKSTTLSAVRGRLAGHTGTVTAIGTNGARVDIREIDAGAWADRIAVVDQRHDSFADRVLDDVLAATGADRSVAVAALDELGLAGFADARADQLSGGQRRRVQVARALVAVRCGAARVIVADEPTAHLDRNHARAVVGALVDAARRDGAMVLIATHDHTVTDVADRVIDIARRSEHAPRGPLDDTERSFDVAQLVVPSNTAVDGATVSTWRALRRVLAVARPARRRLALATLFAVLAEASALGLAATAAWLIVRASEMPTLAALAIAVTGVRGFGIGKGVFRYAERLTSHDAGLTALSELRASIADHLATVAPEGVPGWGRGDVVQRVVHDVDRLLDLFVRIVVPVVALATTVAASIVVMVVLDPLAGLAAGAVAAVVALAVPVVELRRERHIGFALTAARAELASRTLATTEQLDALVAHRMLTTRLTEIGAAAAEVDLHERRRTSARTFSVAVVAAAPVTMAALVLLVVGGGFGPGSAMSAPVLGVLVLWPLTIGEVAGGLADALRSGPEVAASARRVVEVLELESPHRVDPGAELSLPTDRPPRVVLDAAVASWPGSSGSIGPYDLDLAPSTVTSLVGPSGSGKSTLAALLVRFCLLRDGRYLLDGAPADRVDPSRVQAQIVWLEQQPWIGDTSVRENLRLARPDAADADLIGALRVVQLDDWLARLPRGLDTPLGRGGSAISGGEAQRLALARGLLSAHRVVVLDEPTVHLDPTMAARILDDVVNELTGLAGLPGRSVLVIGHDERSTATAGTAMVRLGT